MEPPFEGRSGPWQRRRLDLVRTTTPDLGDGTATVRIPQMQAATEEGRPPMPSQATVLQEPGFGWRRQVQTSLVAFLAAVMGLQEYSDQVLTPAVQLVLLCLALGVTLLSWKLMHRLYASAAP